MPQLTSTTSGRPYDEALAITRAAIDCRGRRYRTLIVAVVLVAVLSTAGAVVFGSWPTLSGLLLLPPLCAIFLSLDAWIVIAWRRRIVELWADGVLDVRAFAQAVGGLRTLPTQTVATMVASLPTLEGEDLRRAGVRRSLAQTLRAIEAREGYATTAVAAAAVVVAATLVAAIFARLWAPLVGLLFAPMIAFVARTFAARELIRAASRTEQLRESDFDLEAFRAAAARLDWRQVPQRERDRFFERLTPSPQSLA